MYKRRAYSQREQDYSLELRNELEEAEKMILKIGPCRERSLALTKLDEGNRQISRRMDTHGIIVVERFATFHYY